MIRLSVRILFVFTFFILFSVTALAQTHSIWSQKTFLVKDVNTQTTYKSFQKGYAAAAWTEKSRNGYFRAWAEVSPGKTYEFVLVAIGNSDAESITGLWDVKSSGTVVCSGCVGKAYGLNAPVGAGTNYFKIYVGDRDCYKESWHFSGYINNRFDF